MRRDDVGDQSLLIPGESRSSEAEAHAWRLGLVVLDEAFERAREVLGEGVACRRGCSACCAGLFEIHAADAALLRAGLVSSPHAAAIAVRAQRVVAEVEKAARELAAEGESALSGWTAGDGLALPNRAIERLAERADTRCPALGSEGDCLLHAHRPAICRMQGVPWRDPETGADLPDGCRLDPRQAGHAPQPLRFSPLDELREELRVRLGRGPGGESLRHRTFVAEALAGGPAPRETGVLGSAGSPVVSSADPRGGWKEPIDAPAPASGTALASSHARGIPATEERT